MAKGRQHENWVHTSQVMAMLANIHRSEDADVFSWDQFHPGYDPPEPPEATTELLMAMGFRPVEPPAEVTNGG